MPPGKSWPIVSSGGGDGGSISSSSSSSSSSNSSYLSILCSVPGTVLSILHVLPHNNNNDVCKIAISILYRRKLRLGMVKKFS